MHGATPTPDRCAAHDPAAPGTAGRGVASFAVAPLLVAALFLQFLPSLVTPGPLRRAATSRAAAAALARTDSHASSGGSQSSRPLAISRSGRAVGSLPSKPAPGSSVGPLFVAGLGQPHTCSAGVVDSARGNVIVTAAHCLAGTAVGTLFAPGYRNGSAPYGVWVATGAYADGAWLTQQSPHADYVFLTVEPADARSGQSTVQAAVGGAALTLGSPLGRRVTVTGYAEGRDDAPISCTGSVSSTMGEPTIGCASFPSGTSGSPWTVDTPGGPGMVGLIGGLSQGGCTDEASYSPVFSAATAAALRRAASGGPPDRLPVPGPDGC